MNPHTAKVAGPDACRFCDGTGLFARAAYTVGHGHHPGCAFKRTVQGIDGSTREVDASCDGTVEWVACGPCGGTGGREVGM